MTGIETIRAALEISQNWAFSLIEDMKNAPATMPTPKGGNHPLWVLGHLACSEASIVGQFILGEQNPLARWDALFGMNSEPSSDLSRYPTWDELAAEYQKVRARTLQLVSGYTDRDLDKPSKAPADYAAFFGTIGKCLLSVALHMTFHGGQVADARRAAGRKPILA